MLRTEETRLFDFMAGQVKAFDEPTALTGAGVVLSSATLAALYYFLGQQRWNPNAALFLKTAEQLDPAVADEFLVNFKALGVLPARLNDMTAARFRQLCAA